MNTSNKSINKRLLVTGGAGFIGSAFIRYSLAKVTRIVNLDLLTYAGSLNNVSIVADDPRYRFVQGDICNQILVERLCREENIDTIVHFAAETHVDRSIASPLDFFATNVGGTLALLEVVRKLPHLHFHHISTDEVYGSLSAGHFTEDSPYRPNSPYAASKAASDHAVRSYANTYQISTTISHCSNNYGPGQFPEKFIPHMLLRALQGRPLPVYGRGDNVRDWLYVDDHVEAIWAILNQGKKGETYAISGRCERRNIDLLQQLLNLLAASRGEDPAHYRSLITFVADRPGHDFRYALDATKIWRELGWRPRHTLEEGLRKTIQEYLCQKPSPASSLRA